MYNKFILLTGVTGFICSNLTIYLVQKYKNVQFIGIDKMSYCSHLGNIQEIKNNDNFVFIQADITDMDKINSIFQTYNIHTVIHLAAYSHVDMSFGNSIIFTQNNVLGTHILLEISKKYNVKRFLHMSTDEVYGSKDHLCTEDSITDPSNPYSASKTAAEAFVKSYYHSFKLPVVIVRCNNVYGPKQYPEKVIPKFILKLLNNDICRIQGSGKQMRSFLYVDDVVNALDIILTNGNVGEIYNVGGIIEYPIIDITKKLVNMIKPDENPDNFIEYVKDRDFNDQRYYISNDKITNLGWKQTIDFDKGLELTLDWYSKNRNYWEQVNISEM